MEKRWSVTGRNLPSKDEILYSSRKLGNCQNVVSRINEQFLFV